MFPVVSLQPLKLTLKTALLGPGRVLEFVFQPGLSLTLPDAPVQEMVPVALIELPREDLPAEATVWVANTMPTVSVMARTTMTGLCRISTCLPLLIRNEAGWTEPFVRESPLIPPTF